MQSKIQIENNINACIYFDSDVEDLSLLERGKKTKNALNTQKKVKTEYDDPETEKYLVCTQCRYPITRAKDRIKVNEKHEHTFANPHGYIYHIGCFSLAPGCLTSEQETSHFSWFQGYNWRIAVCRQCWILIGWAFRSNDSQFFGLILDKLITN